MKKTKEIIALLLVIIMVIACIPLKSLAITDDEKPNYAEIHLRNATGISVENNKATISYDGGTAELTGTDLVGEVNNNWNYGNHIGTMVILYTKSTQIQFNTIPNEGKNAIAWDNGNRIELTNNSYTLNNILTKAQNSNGYDVEFTFEEQQGGNNNNPEQNQNQNQNPAPYNPENNNQVPNGGEDDIDFNIKFNGAAGLVVCNNKSVLNEETSLNKTIEKIGTTDASKTNVLKIQERFGDPALTSVVINGVAYQRDNTNVQIDPVDEGWIITVPGASKYTIKAEATGAKKTTIIWANIGANKNAADYDEDMVLKHGAAKIVAMYDKNGNKKSGEVKVDSDGMGWAVADEGDKVVFEFVPEYGYQLTSVKANGLPLEAQDTTNQYVFTMPNTNIHFSAEFTKTVDIVKANSEKVSSGEIKLGDNLAGGTAQLTVKDVNLSEEKIKGFTNAANGYKVSNFLDIDLYNVFYKGKADSQDVWSNKISELNKEATITLKLEEGVSADDIVIVHNIHDGEEYEVIQIDSYNKETNEITFKTKSFSNYAIATKEAEIKEVDKKDTDKNEEKVEEAKTNNPITGDNIMVLIAIFVVSAIGVMVVIKRNKKEKIRKH